MQNYTESGLICNLMVNQDVHKLNPFLQEGVCVVMITIIMLTVRLPKCSKINKMNTLKKKKHLYL